MHNTTFHVILFFIDVQNRKSLKKDINMIALFLRSFLECFKKIINPIFIRITFGQHNRDINDRIMAQEISDYNKQLSLLSVM